MNNLEKNLNYVIDSEKTIYDRDYELMIKEFKIRDARTKYIQKNAQKLRTINTKWRQSIERYRESRDHFFNDEREQIKKKMDEKSNSTHKHLKENNEKKMQFLTELHSKNQNSELNIKKNLETTSYENENYRLSLQMKLDAKIKKQSKKNKEVLEGIKTEFEKRSYKSMQSFNRKYNQVTQINEDKIKANLEKPISKFENWFVGHQTRANRQKQNKKLLQEDIRERKKEYFEELEEKRLKNGRGILDKLKQSELKRDKIKRGLSELLRKKSEDTNEKFLRLLEKRNTYKLQRLERGQDVLNRQYYSIIKAKEIEDINAESKFTIYEKSIIGQIESENKVRGFWKKFNECKSRSLIKKSPEERRKIYLDLKKQEEIARKKKEEEEKKKTGNI